MSISGGMALPPDFDPFEDRPNTARRPLTAREITSTWTTGYAQVIPDSQADTAAAQSFQDLINHEMQQAMQQSQQIYRHYGTQTFTDQAPGLASQYIYAPGVIGGAATPTQPNRVPGLERPININAKAIALMEERKRKSATAKSTRGEAMSAAKRINEMIRALGAISED